ncbi:MAG: hypothetical protein WC707_00520 [Candidatus Babeliaceae bacterium]
MGLLFLLESPPYIYYTLILSGTCLQRLINQQKKKNGTKLLEIGKENTEVDGKYE